jgi:predicted transposase YdaD
VKGKKYIQGIVNQLRNKTDPQNQAIIDLISTMMVYKFPELSRGAIEAMFSVSELKRTRVYQEAKDEGRTEGQLEKAQSFVLRLLNRRFAQIAPSTEAQIRSLSLNQLEELGEALLDFRDASEVNDWLEQI